ncbi:MAG: alpha/beta hydrolase domain-containing protein, partial [Acidobacteriota bacterium]
MAPATLAAGVREIQITGRSDVLNGEAMGAAGPYQRIVAKAHFAVDPKLAANRIISDIDLAPRNQKGLVEFSADLYMLMPRDPAKGNGTVFFEVSNRGGKGMLSTFNLATSARDPQRPEHFGDRFLLEQGYTLVWLGWQWDVPRNPELLRLDAPVAKRDGQPVTGLVRAEFIADRRVTVQPLADRDHIPYPVMNPDDPSIQLTVRDRAAAPRSVVPRNRWCFPDREHIEMPSGFEPGKIYELVYRAQNPVLAGLGPAAVRDLISFLKYGGAETQLADRRQYVKRAIGFGTSQSGRFLRTFLYYGFNQDEQGRRVFDGVWAHVAG